MMLYSIATGVFIGGAAAFLGTLMLSRKMSLVAGPLGHLTLPGVALALLYGFSISLGAFPFVFLGALAIWYLEAKTKLPMEALTAVVFASAVAISFLFLPIEQAEMALVGDISGVTFFETIASILTSVIIFLLVARTYSDIVLINISEDLARAEGVDIKKQNLLYLLSIATVVSLGVKVVGGLLTAALVAIPAATARNMSKNLKQYILISIILGSLSALIGTLSSFYLSLPAGPLIITMNALFFLISVNFTKR